MFEIRPTNIPGCLELAPAVRSDPRGRFVKTFHADFFASNGLAANFREQYYSVSSRGVLRGLHFQRPPADNDKVVFCTDGEVMDVALDLRRGSPTYGQHSVVEISSERGNLLYMPRGLAHGFYVRSVIATMVYNVTSAYDAANDTGVLWSSAGINWPDPKPLVSERDARLPPLSGFDSPFVYSEAPVRKANH